MNSLHIGLNAQLISLAQSYRGAGVSSYSLNLLTALGELAATKECPHRFTAFVNEPGLALDGVEMAVTSWPTHNPLLRILWEQALLPNALHQQGAELVHGLVNVLPLASRLPGVVTVHDLSFVRFPDKFPLAKRSYLTALCRASAHRARQIIAVSQQTAKDLVTFFGIPAARITVVYNGVQPRFTPGTPEEAHSFRQDHDLPERFLLYLGTLEPRKNLTRLVQAFGLWRAQAGHGGEDVRLVLAGAKGWYYTEIFQQVQELGLTDQVLFPGYIPDDELPDWYRAATAFVYPSLFEGFGLPLLEAMACGTPVVCSTAPSLLEVVGESALVVPAQELTQLAAALGQILADVGIREELSQSGIEQASHFSWQRTARETTAVYDAVRP